MRRTRIGGLVVALALVGGLFSGASTSHAKNTPEFVPGEVLVQFRDGTTDAQQAEVRNKIGATKAEKVRGKGNGKGDLELVGGNAVDVLATAALLAQEPAVEFAEPNWVYTTGATSTDTYFANGSLWGMYGAGTSPANQYGSNAAAAWGAGHTGSKAVYVGIIDEGIQYDHPDLVGQVWTNPYDAVDGVDNDGNGYVDDIRGWDFDGNNNTIYDGGTRGNLDDHGTHVAGTIGAKSNGTGVVGVNWNVTLIAGKFLGRRGGTTANAIKAVDYFTDLKTRHGLNIVATNNSWGGGGFSQALFNAIERSNVAGILFIAAAGNGGSDSVGDNNDSAPHYPANYSNANIISVASITSTGARSSFSNYGANSVDIGAPGSGIYSTTAFNLYESYSGTSMATPHVTGAAALYASVHPGVSAEKIKIAILSSAVPTASLDGRTSTGGRLDAFGALSK